MATWIFRMQINGREDLEKEEADFTATWLLDIVTLTESAPCSS